MNYKVKCPTCEWEGGDDDLSWIDNVHERVLPGELMPEGQCPDCGGLIPVEMEAVPDYTLDACVAESRRRTGGVTVFMADLFDLVSAAEFVAINGYEIDETHFMGTSEETGMVVMNCGEDHSWCFEKQTVSVEGGSCVAVTSADWNEDESEQVYLEVSDRRPITAEDVHTWKGENNDHS